MSEAIDQQETQSTPAPPGAVRAPSEMGQEEVAARERARRYRLKFIDLKVEEPAYDLIHELPVELMVRHSFVPMKREAEKK